MSLSLIPVLGTTKIMLFFQLFYTCGFTWFFKVITVLIIFTTAVIQFTYCSQCSQYESTTATGGPPKRLAEKVIREFVTSSFSDCFASCLPTDLCVGQTVLHLADHTYRCQLITLDTSRYADVSSRVSDVSACASNPCMNQGQCVDRHEVSFVCQCAPLYIGDRCQTATPCASNPCMNGGTCSNDVTTLANFTCQCAQDYVGQQCQFVIPCSSNPCLNGGVCYNDITYTTFTCTCLRGYTDQLCSATLPPVTFYTSADDVHIMYADGAYVGLYYDYTRVFSTVIPASTRVVAVLIVNTGTYGGFLGSSTNGLWVTNGTWRCLSNTPIGSWTLADYDDSSWPLATATIKNGASYSPWGNRPNISTSAYWIWVGYYGNGLPMVFCRKTIQT